VARITIDYTPAIHQGAGIGRLTRELVRAVLRARSLHRYSLFVMGRPDTDVPLSSVMHTASLPLRVTRHTDRWLYRLWFRANVLVPVQTFSGPCDLYHATDFVLPPLRRGTPSVLTVHDLSFERDPASASPRLIPFLKRVVPMSARIATHIVADSHATAHDLVELYGIPDAKITTIHCGVESRFMPYDGTQFLERRRAAVLKRYGIGDTPYILTVGTMQRRKNHLRLVQAFGRLVERQSVRLIADARTHGCADARPALVIAGGKGWLYDEVREEVHALGLQERVKFIGFVDDGDLPHLYRAAVAFAFPSIYEGFGLPPLEAMASGVPVVTSNVSSLPEVVGDAALQVDPFDVEGLAAALERALCDESWRAEAISRGLARAQRFSWSGAAERLLSVYERALAQAGRAVQSAA
jgi:glycosyltransferase involved in cell wall biosynthesis